MGSNLNFRSPVVPMLIGTTSTLVLVLMVVVILALSGGAAAVSDKATAIAGLIISGTVISNQLVNIALEDRRTQEDGELEAQRARETALQNYNEKVGELLIEKPLLRASPGENLSTVVRGQTLSMLEGLDPDRKRVLLLFLYESGLIYKRRPVVSLVAAKLIDANLSGAYLSEANLSGTNLSYADLEGAKNSTNEQLEQAKTFEGAIMPDGSKHS
jgi:hypothetical protein